ncbi:MAG: CinA family nicotinamide mononucleotide deamidase-related protein [Prevotellaceae bacterium]|jgi:nicotinamide-nucleotide amidase|nr:CinA family nicotinamide mononucleotide deamidase-related protein [Prevotellaceae bacterium]
MKASILTVGDEILIGQIVDTNSSYIAQRLGEQGLSICEMRSVGDTREAITGALNELFAASGIVVITGGLGPTKDDITKQTLAAYFGATRMALHEPTLRHVTELLGRRGIALGELNRNQALIPDACEALLNLAGTAPGMWFEKAGKLAVSLPGVPHEMEYLMANEVIPRLKKRFSLGKVYHKHIATAGIAESTLAETIAAWESVLPDYLRLAYLPSPAGVKLRLSCYAADAHTSVADEVEKIYLRQLQALIPAYIVGYDGDTLESAVGRLLKARGATLATAESCTGGRIAALITAQPGASAYFKGGIVAYSNELKVKELGVSPSDIERHGAVSQAVVEQMAQGAQRALQAEYAVATSGIAGPDGGTPEKPVGTVWIATATPDKVTSRKLNLGNDRERTILRTSYGVLNLLRLALTDDNNAR